MDKFMLTPGGVGRQLISLMLQLRAACFHSIISNDNSSKAGFHCHVIRSHSRSGKSIETWTSSSSLFNLYSGYGWIRFVLFLLITPKIEIGQSVRCVFVSLWNRLLELITGILSVVKPYIRLQCFFFNFRITYVSYRFCNNEKIGNSVF